MTSFCTWTEQDGVYRLTLAGDDDHHYLTRERVDDLTHTLAIIRERAMDQKPPAAARALITASSAGSFCDGVDYDRASPWEKQAAADGMVAVIRELLAMPMLTVCAATGDACSLGLVLALAHDDVVVVSKGRNHLGMVEKGVAVPPHVGALLREKTDRWYTLGMRVMSPSRHDRGSYLKQWKVVDGEAEDRDGVLAEAERLASAWDGDDGEAHAGMRRQLCRDSWEAVSGAQTRFR